MQGNYSPGADSSRPPRTSDGARRADALGPILTLAGAVLAFAATFLPAAALPPFVENYWVEQDSLFGLVVIVALVAVAALSTISLSLRSRKLRITTGVIAPISGTYVIVVAVVTIGSLLDLGFEIAIGVSIHIAMAALIIVGGILTLIRGRRRAGAGAPHQLDGQFPQASFAPATPHRQQPEPWRPQRSDQGQPPRTYPPAPNAPPPPPPPPPPRY